MAAEARSRITPQGSQQGNRREARLARWLKAGRVDPVQPARPDGGASALNGLKASPVPFAAGFIFFERAPVLEMPSLQSRKHGWSAGP